MNAAKPQVSAKGIRQSSDVERKHQKEVAAAVAQQSNDRRRRGGQKDTIIIEDWERKKGYTGKVEAKRKIQKERAEKARNEQSLRSGIIQLRSQNLTYADESAWSVHDVESVMGTTPAGPIVARAEFLISSFGGPIPMGKRAIQYTEVSGNCSSLKPRPKPGVSKNSC